MTDETPDPLTDETTPAPDEGPEYVVTPTLRAFGELVSRVEDLEADTAAHAGEDDEDDAEDAATAGRLDRHRAEIEAIKRTLNALIEYIVVPGSPAPTPLQPAPTAETTATDTTTGAPA